MASSVKLEGSSSSSSVGHPVFTTADDNRLNDAEYGFLSEYLAEPGKKGDDEDDISDEEDMSSGDENGDGKKRRLDDRPKTKDQIDRRRLEMSDFRKRFV
jgi:hypothetical protein